MYRSVGLSSLRSISIIYSSLICLSFCQYQSVYSLSSVCNLSSVICHLSLCVCFYHLVVYLPIPYQSIYPLPLTISISQLSQSTCDRPSLRTSVHHLLSHGLCTFLLHPRADSLLVVGSHEKEPSDSCIPKTQLADRPQVMTQNNKCLHKNGDSVLLQRRFGVLCSDRRTFKTHLQSTCRDSLYFKELIEERY